MSLRLLASPAADDLQQRCPLIPRRARARSGPIAARPFQAWPENAITLRDGLSSSRCTPSRCVTVGHRYLWPGRELIDNPDETVGLLRLGLHRMPIGGFPCRAASPPSWPPTTAPSNSGAPRHRATRADHADPRGPQYAQPREQRTPARNDLDRALWGSRTWPLVLIWAFRRLACIR
jgi:hypothetical protein